MLAKKNRLLLSMITIILLCVYTTPFAKDSKSINVCDRLSGTWFGSYTFKNKSDCDRANGCTQGLNLILRKSSDNTFHATAIHTRGKVVEFDISCQNNIVSIPSTLNGTLNVTCAEDSFCTAKYDDAKVLATVMNVNGDSP